MTEPAKFVLPCPDCEKPVTWAYFTIEDDDTVTLWGTCRTSYGPDGQVLALGCDDNELIYMNLSSDLKRQLLESAAAKLKFDAIAKETVDDEFRGLIEANNIRLPGDDPTT